MSDGPGSAGQDAAYSTLGGMILWPLLFIIACAALLSGNAKPMLKLFGYEEDEADKGSVEKSEEAK